MNILQFLIPKSHVDYAYDDFSMRQVAEKLSFHGYSAIPLLDKAGRYVRTVSSSDLFFYIMKNDTMDFHEAENTPILMIPVTHEVKALRYDAPVKDYYETALNQNYIPVIDDKQHFMGIIRRRELLDYLYHQPRKEE